MIFFRKGVRSVNKKGAEIKYDLEGPINFAVFPGHQVFKFFKERAGLIITQLLRWQSHLNKLNPKNSKNIRPKYWLMQNAWNLNSENVDTIWFLVIMEG